MSVIQEIESLDRSIHKAQMRIAYATMQGNELHPSQFPFIGVLEEVGKVNQTELAKHVGVSNASAGTSVRRMEKMGLVKRTVDESDLRATYVELTEKGKMYSDAAKKYIMQLSEIKYQGFSEDELVMLKDFMQRTYKNYIEYSAELEREKT